MSVVYAECEVLKDEPDKAWVYGVWEKPFLPVFSAESGILAVDVTDLANRPKMHDLYIISENRFDRAPEPPRQPNYSLDVLVNGSPGEVIVAPAETVTIDMTALKDGTKTTDFDGNTHRVPIFDVDGSKAAIIRVTLQNGAASATFAPGEIGIYTVDTTKIHPAVTKASIPNTPVVIAE